MNKFITKYTTMLLIALTLSSCALLDRGIVIPTPTEDIRG